MFYVYEWFNKNTNEIFYVGKGTKNRYKQIRKRNKLFLEYINNNECDVRIIKYFDNEEEAFNYEHIRICKLKNIGQYDCNLDNGGKGGIKFIWTPEMRKYYSKYNVMKSIKQRERMSKNNPMKNKKISQKVAKAKSRLVIIENKLFSSLKEAGKYYKVFPTEIQYWCKRGYDRNKQPCRYADEKQKEFVLKTTNSKKVIVDDKIFNSVREASNYLGVWSESIIRSIKNNKPCKGHICKYDNQ